MRYRLPGGVQAVGWGKGRARLGVREPSEGAVIGRRQPGGSGRAASLLLALILVLLPLFLLGARPLAAEGTGAKNLHPLLGKLASENPNDTVRVIVQGSLDGTRLGTAIEQKGGKEKKALPLVRGFSAQMPARAAKELAEQPGITWITLDAPMRSTVDVRQLASVYPEAVGAPTVWNSPGHYTGLGVTVAVLDSGINNALADFGGGNTHQNRVVTAVKFSPDPSTARDGYGHGTHVAGIIGGNGAIGHGKYIGIAPEANLISVQVADRLGTAYLSDVINGLQWVVQNRDLYKIRVVNLSLVSSVAESYLTSPIAAAVERVWLSGIVVVVAAGNLGPDSMVYPPANDPFVITVGAVDNNNTADIYDDLVPSWSSTGLTQNGFAKPEVLAPGRQMVSVLAGGGCELAKQFPERIVDVAYLRLSGTSMAAPVVSGITALVLQAHPTWTPDQVKSVLVATSRPLRTGRGAEVDALKAVGSRTASYANKGIAFNLEIAAATGSATFDAATWNSATWNSATWNSATWNSATWNSATWNSATWNSATWNSATWNSATWNSATWSSAYPD